MKLFGLIEQMYIESIFPLNPIVPSHSDLFKVLEKYGNDKNLSVGLQSDITKKVFRIKPLEFHRQEVYSELFEYFNKNGRKIHFLESMEHFEGLAEIATRRIENKKKLKDPKGNEKEVVLEDYKLEVEFKHRTAIGINEFLLKNIALYKPDLVFVGDSHANLFYVKRQEIKEKYGIEIEEYYRDKILKEPNQDDLMFAASASDKHLRMGDILKRDLKMVTEKVDSSQKIEQELETLLIQREYDAISRNRITNGNPHFIGTWDLEIEPRGLFEVYVDETFPMKKDQELFGKFKDDCIIITGRIEDCLGTATFNGELYKNEIKFVKAYDPKKNIGGYPEKVFYEAKLNDGEFIGKYHIGDISKSFKLKQLKEI